MVDVVDWPLHTLHPVEIGIDLAHFSRDGGQGVNGVTQIVSPLASLWELSFGFGLMKAPRIRTYRAIKARLQGRFNHCRMPICDPFRVRFADAGWPEPEPGIPFSDGAFFDDGTGWASPDIDTDVGVAGELGDSEVTLNVSSIGDALGVGHFFSIDDFLYLVTQLGTKVGSNRTFRIAPPLRADVAVNDTAKIGRPTIRCRLAEDRSGAIRMRFGGRFGEPSMEFVEALDR